jgi:hypothetical protein
MEFPSFGSFNPNSIKGFDPSAIKNLTVEDVKDFLIAKKFEVLSVVILIAGVAGTVVISSNATNEADLLSDQVRVLREKVDPIKKYKKAEEEKSRIVQSLPRALAEDDFISTLTDIAGKRGVRITDFVPPTVQESQYFRKLTSRITCVASTFREAVSFVNDIEKSEYALRIEGWVIRPEQSRSSGFDASRGIGKSSSRGFTMDIVVSSTKIILGQKESGQKEKVEKNDQ